MQSTRQLVAYLIADDNPSPWRVVVIGQTEAWYRERPSGDRQRL